MTMRTTALLGCGVVAGPLFVATFLIEGATRDGYHPLRHPVSSLALGEHGWTQSANFLVAGLLTVAFAIGLRQASGSPGSSLWAPLLVGIWGIGLLGAGLFVTDPVSGYPPGTPDALTAYTPSGQVHDLFSVPGFISLCAACFVFTRRFVAWRERGWAIYSAATGVGYAAAFVLATMGFEQNPALVEVGGLFQRITVVAGWTWLTLLAVKAIRARRSASARVVLAG
jgi:hypothetical protein